MGSRNKLYLRIMFAILLLPVLLLNTLVFSVIACIGLFMGRVVVIFKSITLWTGDLSKLEREACKKDLHDGVIATFIIPLFFYSQVQGFILTGKIMIGETD